MSDKFEWEKAISDVENFNDFYKTFDVLRKTSTADQILSALSEYRNPLEMSGKQGIDDALWAIAALRVNRHPSAYAAPTEINTHPLGFHYWTDENYLDTKSAKAFKNLEKSAVSLIGWSDYSSFEDPSDLEEMELDFDTSDVPALKQKLLKATKQFIVDLDKYAHVIQDMMNDIYPETFKYEGFKIENPDRLAKPLVHTLLGGIRFLVDFFKNRKLEKIFKEGIKFFRLKLSIPRQQNEAAEFNIPGRYITVYSSLNLLGQGSGRFMNSWLKEVFVHEFGHYIHTHYLSGNAQKFWDSWWDQIDQAKDLLEARKEISPAERQGFFSILHHTKFDLSSVLSMWTDSTKIRFSSWLTQPTGPRSEGKFAKPAGKDLTKPVKWTKEGTNLKTLFTDAIEYQNQHLMTDLMKVAEQFKKELGLKDRLEYPLSKLAWKQINSLFSPEVQETGHILSQLHDLPSDYARTNKYEDFAESFVLFVTEPRRLSPLSLYRMKRTLSLSGLYGKPVMTFASVIENLVGEGMDKEAKAILEAHLKENCND